MVSPASSFKEKARKIVQLPSGLEIEIRKIWLLDFIGFGELPWPTQEGDKSSLTASEVFKYLSRAIVKGSVKPQFFEDGEPDVPDRVCVKDLSWDDFDCLGKSILEWSGFERREQAAADAFRGDGLGEDSKSTGREILPPSDGDPPHDA